MNLESFNCWYGDYWFGPRPAGTRPDPQRPNPVFATSYIAVMRNGVQRFFRYNPYGSTVGSVNFAGPDRFAASGAGGRNNTAPRGAP